MNLRIIFALFFCLSACRAQQPAAVEKEAKTETKKTEVEEKKSFEPVSAPKQESFNLFLILPLDLSTAFTFDSIVVDSVYVSEYIDKDVKAVIDFYEGALLAVDSLRKNGADINLKVIDLPGNEELQISAIWKINFENCNAVFSMLRSKPLSTLNEILQAKNIPLISCAANSFSQTEKNKNAICMQPSSLMQCRKMGENSGADFKNDNFIIVTASTDKEQERAHAFINGIEKYIPASQIKKINLALEGRAAFNKMLSGAGTNTIFVPSTDEDFVTNVFAAIDSALDIYRFRVIGLPVWQHFESIDPQTMEKFNTVVFAPDYVNYNSPAVFNFRKKFRQVFRTEPGDGAYLSFDSFSLFGNYISGNELYKTEYRYSGLRSSYYFVRENPEGALENQWINILLLSGFRFIKVN